MLRYDYSVVFPTFLDIKLLIILSSAHFEPQAKNISLSTDGIQARRM